VVIYKFRNVNTGQATPVPPGEFTVGRDDHAYVHIEDGSVSRKHAKLYNTDEGLFVEDVGSANGTAARGAFIAARTKIEYGEVIYIGSVPFRVDPEIAGEPTAAPSAGTRVANRDYMRRNTERLPAYSEAPRVVEMLPTEPLASLKVDEAVAEKPNAIALRESQPLDPLRLPVIRPGLTPLPPKSPSPAIPPRHSATSASQSLTPPKVQNYPKPSRPLPPPDPEPTVFAAPLPFKEATPPEPIAPGQPAVGFDWKWLALVFLAGLGTGLLLGLYFAKLFIDLGGKAVALP